MDSGILLTGLVVFLARIIDVSIGTLRTLFIVRGKTKIAFVLGFIEINMWLLVLSTVLEKVMAYPVIALFYAFGFSTGNVVGILIERKIAIGHLILRVITPVHGEIMATQIRESGFPVTTVEGEGAKGKVTVLYIACERKHVKKIIPIVHEIDPDAFYITEQAGSVSKLHHTQTMVPRTGWRAIFKKK